MLEAVIILAVLGAVFGAILAIAGRKLYVFVDPRVEQITELLPGANCGSCGFPGCNGLAEAIVTGEIGAFPCVACTKESKVKIAQIMGITEELPLSEEVRRVARLSCAGCKNSGNSDFEYTGITDCHVAAKSLNSPGKCNFGCFGFGTCVRNCPFDAITMGADHRPVFDYAKCRGCGVCVSICPQRALYLADINFSIHLNCNNREQGKKAMLAGDTSCISCGICVRTCPEGAITMQNDDNGCIPVINSAKCTECGLCVEKCPRHALQKLPPIETDFEFCKTPPKEPSGCAACPFSSGCAVRKD